MRGISESHSSLFSIYVVEKFALESAQRALPVFFYIFSLASPLCSLALSLVALPFVKP